jgi:hypothetical protein
MKRALTAFIFLFVFASFGQDELKDLSGKIYQKDSKRKDLLFNFHFKSSDAFVGGTADYTYPDGKLAMRETLTLTKQHELAEFSIEDFQQDAKGSVRVDDKKLYFTFKSGEDTKTAEEERPDNLLVGPLMPAYIKTHWNQIMNGDEVKVRLAVLNRLETIGFKFFKVEEKNEDGKAVVIVKMKASSFVVAAIVDPLYFTFLKSGVKLLHWTGRTLPKLEINGKWKDLDAETVYN